MNPDDIQKQVAQDLGITDLPDEEQKQVIAEFGAVALQASTIAVLEAMSEENRVAFGKLLEAQDQEGAAKFLDTNLPNHETVARQAVAAEIDKFKAFQKTL